MKFKNILGVIVTVLFFSPLAMGKGSEKVEFDSQFIKTVEEKIDIYPNFKKEGVLYREFDRLFADPVLFKRVISTMASKYAGIKIDVVAGLESRGFFFGVPLALELGASFMPIRKPGKLASPTHRMTYKTEYSEDVMEMRAGDLSGKTVLIVDDVLATGGTLRAAESMLRSAGVKDLYSTVLIELKNLDGLKTLSSHFSTLLTFEK